MFRFMNFAKSAPRPVDEARSVRAPAALCVFASAGAPCDAQCKEWIGAIAEIAAEAGATVIYGGGPNGLMAELAAACLRRGVPMAAHRPRFMAEREPALPEGVVSVESETLAQRKDGFFTEGEAFIILPGGIGTLDELFSLMERDWQRGLKRPILVANIEGTWDSLRELLFTLNKRGLVEDEKLAPIDFYDHLEAFKAALVQVIAEKAEA